MKPIKLTKPQLTMLEVIYSKPCYVWKGYKTALVLKRLGLAEWNGSRLQATEAGRKHIESLREEK